jgi:hypothetical protein
VSAPDPYGAIPLTLATQDLHAARFDRAAIAFTTAQQAGDHDTMIAALAEQDAALAVLRACARCLRSAVEGPARRTAQADPA